MQSKVSPEEIIVYIFRELCKEENIGKYFSQTRISRMLNWSTQNGKTSIYPENIRDCLACYVDSGLVEILSKQIKTGEKVEYRVNPKRIQEAKELISAS